MSPRPWTAAPMWERTKTPWWKLLDAKKEPIAVSLSEADAKAIAEWSEVR